MALTAIAVLSVAAFMAAFWLAGIVPVARRAIAVVNEALASLRDPAIGDDIREARMRSGSVALLGAFFQIALRSAVAVAAALIPIILADWAGFAPRASVFAFMARLDVIAALTVATGLVWYLCSRVWRSR